MKEHKLGTRWDRLLAYTIDSLIITVIWGIATLIIAFLAKLPIFFDDVSAAALSMYFVAAFVSVFYYVVMEAGKKQATYGKQMMKLKVVDSQGKRITFLRSVVRNVFGKALSSMIFGIGYIWLFFDKNQQGWHDKIAGTFVVKSD